MQLTDGWATEYNRKKFSVSLDDGDWRDLLIDAGVHPDIHVPLTSKYQMLKLQAAVLCLVAMVEYLAGQPDQTDLAAVQAELKGKRETLQTWTKSLAAKYAAPKAEEPKPEG